MEMQKNLERIIAETSAVAIPVTAQPGRKKTGFVTATPMKVSRAITEIIWTPRPGQSCIVSERPAVYTHGFATLLVSFRLSAMVWFY